jgi:hypothetical protein
MMKTMMTTDNHIASNVVVDAVDIYVAAPFSCCVATSRRYPWETGYKHERGNYSFSLLITLVIITIG